MPSLFHSLNIGSQSLYANRQGLDTTAHNIANAQTEGYSRQKIRIDQRDPTLSGLQVIGNGVYVGSINRSHDKYLEKELTHAEASLGDSTKRLDELFKLEQFFNPELDSTIANKIGTFFDSLQAMSNFPEELPARTAVRENAIGLTTTFRHVDERLRNQRRHVNDHINSTLSEVNAHLKNVAILNVQIQQMEGGTDQHANDLRDQRDRLVRSLSENLDIKYYDDQHGMVTIRGPGEAVLVDRNRAATIAGRVNRENDGMFDIHAVDFEGNRSINMSPFLAGGKLKALSDVRDEVIPTLLKETNSLAFSVAKEMNTLHRRGYGIKDFSEKSGRNFFVEPLNEETAAQNMKLDATIAGSVESIAAASSPKAPGDNVNLNAMLELKDKKLLLNGTANFTEYYANYVGVLGIETARTKLVMESDEVLQADLHSRRESVSGVSLDEEATNMLKWQTAFAASSKVIMTVNEMLETVLALKR